VKVVTGAATAALLRDGADAELGVDAARREGVYPADYRFRNYDPDRTVAPPAELSVAGRTFEAVPLPGHAADHVVYLTETDRTCCFVGDAVYPGGEISLLNVPGSSLADYRECIGALTGRGVDALCPGHGQARLRDGQASIEAAADALAGMSTPPSRT
jgi:glyoxylase-like metal-dependent hydrolase (beta-lactamase superfamily II)